MAVTEWNPLPAVRTRTKWEYKQVRIKWSVDRLGAVMNGIGAEGWELVSVSDSTLYFKRPIDEKE